MKTTLRLSNIVYRVYSLPIDISNNEMVKIMLHMVAEVVNYGCILIFVSTCRRVPYQDSEILVETQIYSRANRPIPNIEEEVLPQLMSSQ